MANTLPWRQPKPSVGSEEPRSTTCYAAAMAETINQRTLRNQSGEIMRRVEKGESFVITRDGEPLAELVPLRRPRFVALDKVLPLFARAAPVDIGELRRDLDAFADQSMEPHH